MIAKLDIFSSVTAFYFSW